ncbi:hypothetical protein [Paenibacillus tianjinensis]|uniref:Phosphodiester glycosidase domain-containing protein n=1 Tax=Paenibacillus tianjinensis TaxID=2810347 RepID=A0ABX7LH27_9BACL|nr:hypothetical protein [Paenibacillus tianjinensis]QSF46214.1 hypothetical protein JRJ22_06300 [Paenibacillus tianjinensis]
MAYTYSKVTASNGVVLQSIKTSPNEVYMKGLPGGSTIPGQSSDGINGSFFDFGTGSLLTIAVNNDIPVGPGTKDDYGSGYQNAGYARGTLVWDSREQQFSVQIVSSAASLNVISRYQYWAQGGISMTLGNDSTWASIADQQNMPNRTGNAMRAGLVYNNTNNIWLVVTNTLCTAAQFRSAIKEKIGSGTLVNGIFLDGSGSAQLKAGTNVATGDGRKVFSMVALR